MHKRTLSRLVDLTFLLPVLLLFAVVVALPFLEGIPLSLTNWDGMNAGRDYVGMKNYLNLLSDKHLWSAAKSTVVFTVITLVGSNLLGLGVAVLISRTGRLNNIVRTLIFMPFCLSMLLQSYIWKYIFSDVFYGALGWTNPLATTHLVMLGLSVICIWADTGYCMVIYIAALQGIPRDYYEAADIEGCSPWHKFTAITLPMLAPAFTTNITLYLGWGMKVFDYPMAATAGGPGRSSETIAMLIYNNLFGYFKAGYGQAIAIVFTVVIFLVSALTAFLLRRREVEL